MVDRAAADVLAAALELCLDAVVVCPGCLFGVAMELDKSDERAIRAAVRFFAPLLWDEGLEEPVRAALEQACRAGVDGAEAAFADVEARGPRSGVFDAVVRLLASRQLEEAKRRYITSQN